LRNEGTVKTRRRFLEQTIGAAAAVSLSTRLAAADAASEGGTPVPQSAPRAPLGADEPIRVGFISTGGMGTGHVEAFLGLAKAGRANLRVEALCDVCDPRAAEAKRKVDAAQGGEVATTRDHRQLLARKDLHGVVISTPEHWHGRQAEDAIRAGKDVFVEKPMTLTLADALRLRKVALANPQVVLLVGTQFVVSPAYAAARQIVADGTIGTPVWSRTSYCRNSREGEWLYYKIDPAWQPGVNLDWKTWCGPLGQVPWNPEIYARWRRYRKYSTGIIGDLLVHHMTPLVMAMGLGWPTRVVATGAHMVDKKMENPDQVNITVQFDNGHTMVVAGSTSNALGLERVIHGHKANLIVGARDVTVRPERRYADEVTEKVVPAAPTGNLQDDLRLHWLDCIRTRQTPASDIELGTKIMVIVDLATRAIWTGKAFAYDHARQKVREL
jgi:predicted dehydrogenase